MLMLTDKPVPPIQEAALTYVGFWLNTWFAMWTMFR